MFPFHKRVTNPAEPVEPLSDEQARAQVVDPAKEVAKAAGLHVVRATFAWEWCNDQGEPPYHGRVDVLFDVPAEADRSAYFQQIATTMARQPGWSDGPRPGMRPFGASVHKGGTTAVIGESGTLGKHGSVELYGECRNMNDHRDDSGWHDITDEFTGG